MSLGGCQMLNVLLGITGNEWEKTDVSLIKELCKGASIGSKIILLTYPEHVWQLLQLSLQDLFACPEF